MYKERAQRNKKKTEQTERRKKNVQARNVRRKASSKTCTQRTQNVTRRTYCTRDEDTCT